VIRKLGSDSSRTVACVCGGGESYIDEPLVGTVILPQIGELPVHLSWLDWPPGVG